MTDKMPEEAVSNPKPYEGHTPSDEDRAIAKLIASSRKIQRDNGLVYAAALEAAMIARVNKGPAADAMAEALRLWLAYDEGDQDNGFELMLDYANALEATKLALVNWESAS